jgi:hypothetical protein
LGVAIGWAAARATSSAVQSFVLGIRPTDSGVYLAVGGFLAIVGLAAAFDEQRILTIPLANLVNALRMAGLVRDAGLTEELSTQQEIDQRITIQPVM